MEAAPFGSGAIHDDWPYLGADVAGPGGGASWERWTSGAYTTIQIGTWRRAMQKMRMRAEAACLCQCSPGRRAGMWNTYLVSLIPYPTHVSPPSQQQQDAMIEQQRRTMRHTCATWCPIYMLSGLGVVCVVKGAPKCPSATARAVGALACLRQDIWGPRAYAHAYQDMWTAIVD